MEVSTTDQINACVARSQKILLVTGDKFTGDGICALLALQMTLSRTGKEVVAVKSSDADASKFKFLQGFDLVKDNLDEKGNLIISLPQGKSEIEKIEYSTKENATEITISPKNGILSSEGVVFHQTPGNFDLIIALNTPNLESLGTVFTNNTAFFASVPIINIAAEAKNEFFGKINQVDLTKSSTCEILFDWLYGNEKFKQFFDVELATILLAGIISTTNNFVESKTTANALEIAGTLQKIGARQSDIIEHLYKMKTLPMLKIWGSILENLNLDSTHQMAWAHASNKDFRNTRAGIEDVGDLGNDLLRHLNGADLIALFLETEDKVVLEIRTSSFAGINSQELRGIFGGTETHNGIDFKIPKKTLSQTKSEILHQLARFQEKRLHLPENTEIKKVELKNIKDSAKKELFPMNQREVKKTESTPKAPENVPFSLEKKEVATNDTVVPEIPEEIEKKTDIPEWLRKAQNKN